MACLFYISWYRYQSDSVEDTKLSITANIWYNCRDITFDGVDLVRPTSTKKYAEYKK